MKFISEEKQKVFSPTSFIYFENPWFSEPAKKLQNNSGFEFWEGLSGEKKKHDGVCGRSRTILLELERTWARARKLEVNQSFYKWEHNLETPGHNVKMFSGALGLAL